MLSAVARVKLKDSCKTDKKNRRDVEKLPRSRRGVSEFIRSPNRFRRRSQTLLERRRPARARRRGVVPIGSMYNVIGSGGGGDRRCRRHSHSRHPAAFFLLLSVTVAAAAVSYTI